MRRLRRFLARAPSPGARAKLWEQMGEVLDSYEYDVTSMPEYLEEVEDRFGYVTSDLEKAMDDAVFHFRRGAVAKAERSEQAAFRGFGKLRAQTRALLKAAGPAGAEALHRLDAEQAGGGGTGTEA